ncbi:hypothetical protein HBB16_10410 [Pseudonocardia sp. MCCB 268]|nr:hypothetical protein [Pseudonocardia cytotoxica]
MINKFYVADLAPRPQPRRVPGAGRPVGLMISGATPTLRHRDRGIDDHWWWHNGPGMADNDHVAGGGWVGARRGTSPRCNGDGRLAERSRASRSWCKCARPAPGGRGRRAAGRGHGLLAAAAAASRRAAA